MDIFIINMENKTISTSMPHWDRDALVTVKIRNYHEGSCYLINMGNYLSVYERLVMHLWDWQNKMKSTHNQGSRIVRVFKSPHTNIQLCLHTLKIIQGIYWLETEHVREQLQNNSSVRFKVLTWHLGFKNLYFNWIWYFLSIHEVKIF